MSGLYVEGFLNLGVRDYEQVNEDQEGNRQSYQSICTKLARKQRHWSDLTCSTPHAGDGERIIVVRPWEGVRTKYRGCGTLAGRGDPGNLNLTSASTRSGTMEILSDVWVPFLTLRQPGNRIIKCRSQNQ